MSFDLANWCTNNVQCLLSSTFVATRSIPYLHLAESPEVCWMMSSIGKYVDCACANALKHGTITVSGFGYFHKNCRFLWKKNVSKTNLGRTYTIPIHHITNITDFVWFQRSCGSTKSVSPFSSIDSLGKGSCPSFDQNLNLLHFTLRCFVLSLAEIEWWRRRRRRRRRKCEKFTTTTTTAMMDNGEILIRKAHLSLRLKWA